MKKFTIVVKTDLDLISLVKEIDNLNNNPVFRIKLKSILEVQE